MRKLKPDTVRKIFLWVFGIVILLEFISFYAESTILSIFTIVLLFGDAIFHLIFYRCPACGSHLGRNRGSYCPFCGENLSDEEEFK